ncbi:MAG: GNAT family N-acetyltransferase [Pseudomonadaceae bacterium]|nr:GNAT family N-acetyltransferase [Pseudomonadaceae bacterium]
MLSARLITTDDDLDQLTTQINAARWDDANDISDYDREALRYYINHPGTFFIACHDTSVAPATLVGIASARLELKPYAFEHWLYVDEVDVCVDQRRRGAGKAIMRKLLEIAQSNECEELWLGTEDDNVPANALYRSLNPDEEETFIGYTYDMQD